MTDSLLAQVKAITGATNVELAELVELNKNSVDAYVTGRRREFLNAAQVEILKGFVEAHAALVAETAAAFLLFH